MLRRLFVCLVLLASATFARAETLLPEQTFTRDIDLTKTTTCTPPTTRQDGTELLFSEILALDLYLVADLNAPEPEPYASNLMCAADIDLTTLADGKYYIYWRTVDTEARTSARSDIIPFTIQTLTPPNAPTGITLQ